MTEQRSLGINDGLIQSWELSLHDKSPRTTKLYLRILGWFTDWLEANGRPADAPGDLVAVSRQDAEAWFAAQRADGLKATTIRARWVALKAFYRWMVEEEEIAVNPMARVKVAKPEPPPVELLSEHDVKLLFKACGGKDFLSRRDLALLRLLAVTGLRSSEARYLQTDDIDLQRRVVFVRKGKGDKGRFARFDKTTAQLIDRYKRVRSRHRLAGLPWFFLTRSGQLSVNGLPDVLDRRAAQAGLGHVNPHRLRHSWADAMKRSGMSDSDLKELGGWSSDSVMRRYGSIASQERALAAYDINNPFEAL